MKNTSYISILLLIILSCQNIKNDKKQQAETNYAVIALNESTEPVLQEKPGEKNFWNTYSTRFIYAPAFKGTIIDTFLRRPIFGLGISPAC